MIKQIVLTLFCLTLFVAVDAQTVHLSRLQRAAGLGYVPYTDGTGKPAYTLLSSLITPTEFGSGTNNRIAYWLNDTLSSTIWEMNSTYIRGSGTGWPQMDQSSFTFRGDTDTGIERIGSDIVGILAGSANPRIRAMSGVVDFDTDASGTSEWGLQPGLFYSTTSGAPRMFTTNTSSAQYSFTDDTNTGMSRKGADTLGIYAGDEVNPITYFAGVGNKIAFDPNTDGTPDVSISATTLSTELLDIGAYGTTATKIAGLNASGVVTELIVGSGLSISGDSLKANAGLSGSGSASAVATWSSASALTFTDWLILSNTLQGPTLGDPAMSITDDAYSFTGDSNTGLKWSAADIVGLHAGDATNPMIEIDGTTNVITFDPDDDATNDVTISATTLSTELLDIGSYGTTATKIAGLNASGVVTEMTVSTGLSLAADVLTATDASITNELQDLTIGGSGPTYTVDIASGADVTIEASGITTLSEPSANVLRLTTTEIDGSTTNEIQTIDVLSLSGTVLHASLSSDGVADVTVELESLQDVQRLFVGDDNIGSVQVISVGGGAPYDTIAWTTTFQQEQGITYGAPNASADSSIIFERAGVYEVHYTFEGELAAAATNVTVSAKWNKNSTTAVPGSAMQWGFESTEKEHYGGVFQVEVAANDFIQLLMKNSTASASNLSFGVPKIAVKYISSN